jgi:Co/Zn/Cd efflux system component
MKISTSIGMAALLGVIVVTITGHANYATKSMVMFAEMLHSIADTVVPWVGRVSGYFLVTAALGALFFGIPRLIELLGGITTPVQNSFELLLASSLTLAIVWTQLKLTKGVHHLLHSHQHGTSTASYFFGSAKLSLHKTHEVTKTELYADMIQAACGVVIGLIAFYFESTEGVRFFDITISIGLGVWMLWRGIGAIRD